MQIIKAIHKHKQEYPNLYNDYIFARDNKGEPEYLHRFPGSSIKLSEDGIEEYDNMIGKYLRVKRFPNNNRKVVITTAGGGKHVGFYEDGDWWYSTLDNPKVKEKGIVIKWEKNYFPN